MPFASGRPPCCRWLVLLALAAPRLLLADVGTPPRVLGFERIRTLSNHDAVQAGRLLLGELNCTSCHRAATAHEAVIQGKPAPILDSVGSRVRPEYLLLFLADPQATKPGTTMPNVLAHLPSSERVAIVESLVHFLASMGALAHGNPSRHSVRRGEALFHSVGCLACHDPRTAPLPAPLTTSIPLGTPSKKYTLPGLTQFLSDPLAVRPGGRMPHLNLSPGEARDIASFLLNDLDIVSGLEYAYYEGEWEKLPDFSKLQPIAVGEAETFDVSAARRRDHFALRFEGTINIPQDGDYLFLIGSDDGSRLLIDDKPVVVNDGVHSFEQKRKKLKMTAGQHAVAVEYFENAGDEVLQVDFEGPGMSQQPLAALLTAPLKDKPTTPAADAFIIDPEKAAQGRVHFNALRCANCHAVGRASGLPVPVVEASGRPTSAKSLADLPTMGGCLNDHHAKSPRYALDEAQKTALAAAISALKVSVANPPPREAIQHTLVRFNCIACHERDSFGGVEAARDAFFLSDMPEMGDEGRLPPSLTGVGAKLASDWLKKLFDSGTHDRPYMLTRMPKFGLNNVGSLVHDFERADAALHRPAPNLLLAGDDVRRVKAAGRRLVGSQGFSCIKCHTFAGQRSSGIQAISLTTMKSRLRPEWFYHYLQNPLAYRPGTRMPTPFPDGQTTLPAVLDGTIPGQIAAIWTYLADGDKALYPVGLVTGKIELMAFGEPVIYRNFIEGAGTRAIGVGYPEKLNLAFDAENMRLALLWHGGFIDAARHWTARGAGFEKPLGDNILTLPTGPPLAILPDEHAPWPEKHSPEPTTRFSGYRLAEKQRPTFLYSFHGLAIEDYPRPVGDQDVFAIQRTLRISGHVPHAYLRLARAGTIEKTAEHAYRIDNRWTLHVTAIINPILRHSQNEFELLTPIKLQDSTTTIDLTYDW